MSEHLVVIFEIDMDKYTNIMCSHYYDIQWR